MTKERTELNLKCEELQTLIAKLTTHENAVQSCDQAEILATQLNIIRDSISLIDQEQISEKQAECQRLRSEIFEISRLSEVSLEQRVKEEPQISAEEAVDIPKSTDRLAGLQTELESKESEIRALRDQHADLLA